ncbi:ABC transporter permease [Telmatospirillum sp.]|uniref:ABC transporter permease n=1 Tax=Telmatospirillum sp. TaxID=2079197 RepID=UPI00284A726D|nr:ABC transporter permease [Telmatospirillum sp.]MDR3436004.1 ABC transporter permease [Telmatospirillum sp.]
MSDILAQTTTVPALDLKPRSNNYWIGVLRRISRDRLTVICATVLLALILIALLAPWLIPADPYKTSMIRRLLPVGSPGHFLGTDELGRDMIARLAYGGRMSLLIGVMPVLIAFVIGSAVGIFAGFAGGRINMAIMRLLDVFYAFPSVLLAVAISGALGQGTTNSVLALTLIFIPQLTRIAESATTQVRTLEYVDAARMSGASSLTIIRVHILGNVLGPIFVYATGLVSVSMILASGLSFLGLGVKPPEPEWGLMLNTLRSAIYLNPLVAALPGAMIFITSMCFNLMADGIRSAMEVNE